MSAPLQWVLWGFFSTFACQESSLLERISLALAVCQGRELGCPWCFTSSVWALCWCYLLSDPSLPWHAWLCCRHPGFHCIILCCLSHSSHTQGGLPAMGSGICDCSLPAVETPRSSTTSCAGLRPSPATGTACFNFSHSYSLRQWLSCLWLPSFPTLRKGETLHCQRWHVGGRDSERAGRELPLRLIWWNAYFKATKKKGGGGYITLYCEVPLDGDL